MATHADVVFAARLATSAAMLLEAFDRGDETAILVQVLKATLDEYFAEYPSLDFRGGDAA